MSSLPTSVLSASLAHGADALPLDASLTSARALQKEQEVGSSWSKQLLQSLVLRYSERMEHEEHMQQLNIKWMEKQRRWDLTADSLQVRLAVTSRNQF